MPRRADPSDARRLPPPGPRARDVVDNLLSASGRGDLTAFGAFYDQTAASVFGLLRHVLTGSDDAERATERVYLRSWRAAPAFDPADGSALSSLMFDTRRELATAVHGVIATCHPVPQEIPDPDPQPV